MPVEVAAGLFHLLRWHSQESVKTNWVEDARQKEEVILFDLYKRSGFIQ